MELYNEAKHIRVWEANKYIKARESEVSPEKRVYSGYLATMPPFAGRKKEVNGGFIILNEVTAKKVWIPSIGLAVEVFDRQQFTALFAEY